ncbi:hypothetical protein KGM_215270 [Danaus plexippus plexippus]|uniref:Uncharacterized protein n=1 Tax=Danaus plexippus plexippus TaxID=278856 RepID=A0A212EIT5_DANPL|nr:hypothetical protein KGM_215270 [Danaus plexippus plexippus]
MCGDHPSVHKAELTDDTKVTERDAERDKKPPVAQDKVLPTSSQIDKPVSEHGLRVTRHRAGGRDLVHAALSSFRWPPYLLGVWVCVVLLTHALHCAAALLERSLPVVRNACQYSKSWTESSWSAVGRGERGLRVRPLLLALCTAVMYVVYGCLLAAHALLLWAIEPLYGEGEAPGDDLPILTDYLDDGSHINVAHKQ